MPECIDAIERAFVAHATGDLPARPGVLGTHVANGGFHVKTAAIGSAPGYYAAKMNANFPGQRGAARPADDPGPDRPLRYGRPAACWRSWTRSRSRYFARRPPARSPRDYLARRDASTLLVCGCGNQGRAHVRVPCARAPAAPGPRIRQGPGRAAAFADEMRAETGLDVEPVGTIAEAFPTLRHRRDLHAGQEGDRRGRRCASGPVHRGRRRRQRGQAGTRSRHPAAGRASSPTSPSNPRSSARCSTQSPRNS